MRLTADLIARSPVGLNAVGDRAIDLRGNKIPAIENLGATMDQFDVIDLSDNDIRKLENFSLTKRLGTLLVCNNRIHRISPDLETSLLNLHTLILSNNLAAWRGPGMERVVQLSNLTDLQPLATIKTLRMLSLLDNPCSRQAHYRPYVIHLMPHLRVLDFRKIKPQERDAVRKMFAGSAGKSLKAEIQSQATATFVPGGEDTSATGDGAAAAGVPAAAARPGLSAAEVERIQAAIRGASSLEEVARLERLLRSGNLPEAPAPAATDGPGQGDADDEDDAEMVEE